MFDIPGMPAAAGPPNLPVRRNPASPALCVAPRTHSAAHHPQPDSQPRTTAEQWWHHARTCAAALRVGQTPSPVSVFGPVLEAGETAWLSTEIGYSRYCASDGRYSPLPLIVAARPAVMFGALAVQGVVNHRRKAAAQRRSTAQWRWQQICPVIATTDRFICGTAGRGQVSVWFGSCTEFYPDLAQWTLTLGVESDAPVRLSGPATPVLSLLSAYGVFGDAWIDDPRLAPLVS